MPAERYFVDSPLQSGGSVRLEDEEAIHLSRVMRGRPGDVIELVNGRGTLAEAVVKQTGKQFADVDVTRIVRSENPPFPVIIAQALPRLNRIDIIVEKGTELGMTQLWLFPGDQSEKKEISPTQEIRFRNIAISAMKQCGCLHLPEVVYKPAIEKWKALPFQLLFGDVNASAQQLTAYLQKNMPSQGLIFAVGPEKGFSEKEYALLKKLGAVGVNLHPNILRADTAPLCALSQISPHLKT